jgi:hypothetical protein
MSFKPGGAVAMISDKPIQCVVCRERFARLADLLAHRCPAKHRPDPTETP